MKKEMINLNLLQRLPLALIVLLAWTSLYSQQDTTTRRPKFIAENDKCLKCHGHKKYTYINSISRNTITDRMSPYFVIDSAEFYQSNHRYFHCTDCHSTDYDSFPHPGNLRMEPKYVCLYCHGGDPNYAQYHFETINEEFLKSVHSQKHSEDFTCWMCHNPHTYKINAGNNKDVKAVIVYDNEICLNCHADKDKFQLLTNKNNPNITKTHDWLPNQLLHFQNVRCIECHARINDTILVPHNIQPKEKAVRLCVECHSSNSYLMTSLYKYQSRERRNKLGFFNAAILSESYVIGANRNYYLNLWSLLIFGAVSAGILIHAILRRISKK